MKVEFNNRVTTIDLLQLLFLYLKLTNQIDWSWFWVLSPAWAAAVIGIIVFIISYKK